MQAPSPSSVQLSRQDCITAYVTTVLTRCGAAINEVTNATSVSIYISLTVSRLTSVLEYRSASASFVQPDVAGNLIYVV